MIEYSSDIYVKLVRSMASDDSTFRSYPQHEIDVAARKVERNFQEQMPLTHKAFVQNGRVAP